MSSIWVDSANVGSHFVKLKWAGWTLFFLGFSIQTSQYRPLTIQRTPLSFLPFLFSFRSPSLSFLNRFSFSLPQDREGRSRYAQLDGLEDWRLQAGPLGDERRCDSFRGRKGSPWTWRNQNQTLESKKLNKRRREEKVIVEGDKDLDKLLNGKEVSLNVNASHKDKLSQQEINWM